MSVNGEKVKRLLYTYRTTKDMNAYNDLFVENEDLIKGTICKTIHSQNKTNKELIDEYLSVACIGFYKAVEAFDLSRIDDEKYFFSYAHVCIKNSLLEEIKKENRHSLNAVSIHETVKGTDDLTLEDTLEDKDDDIENFIDEESAFYKKKKILEVINKLSDKEKEIVMAYYGFNGRILTVRQIADMFNMSQYSISGIINSLNSYLAKELVEFREEYTLSKQANDSKSPYLPSPQRKYGVIKHGERVKDRRFLNGKEKMERYELLVEKYGESVVKEAIDLLPERNKRMIYLYYGMEGKIPKTQEELSRLFNLVNIDYAISSSMVRVESFLREKDIRVYETSNKGKKLYELIEKYGIEKVEEEIAKLDEIDKRLIEEYYAFGGKRKIDRSKSELSQKFNVSNVPSRVYNALNKIDKRLKVKTI